MHYSIFGPTVPSDYYWSSSTDTGNPAAVWSVSFYAGAVGSAYKPGGRYVRAVRSGS